MSWQKIKAEYVAGGVSLRKLSEKYEVSFSTIQKKSMEEKWGELRKKSGRKTEEKIIEVVSSKEADKATNIIDVADKLIGKICEMLDGDVTNAQSIKSLTSALKDLKEIKGYKSDADMREQEARIAKLQKEAQEEAQDREITIVFGSDAEDYSV